jgi:hypothetical protein
MLHLIDRFNQLKKRRIIYLSFADDPRSFICLWLALQSHDLKRMTESSMGNIEEECRADFQTEQWSYEAALVDSFTIKFNKNEQN